METNLAVTASRTKPCRAAHRDTGTLGQARMGGAKRTLTRFLVTAR
ncbi:hypothetical protein E2C01_101603 [Portunus trituberculatus]|uniref:Uncharacterized protein n=1 Tax=Portunus trituberculatus TaxID=210409 RepID=A0A5B7KG50_PORTR|nr:hypothetical protein [Portunus trituberculatus]